MSSDSGQTLTRRRFLHRLAPLAFYAGQSSTAAQTAARPLECIELYPAADADKGVYIDRPGRWCVVEDFLQRGNYFAPPRFDHALIEIGGSDVLLDLAGHTLRSEYRSSGDRREHGARHGLQKGPGGLREHHSQNRRHEPVGST